MQFKQTVNPLNCEAHVAKNMFWNIHKYPATVHINPLNTTWTRQQSPLPRPPSGKEMNWPAAYRKPWDSGVCLNGTTVLLFILFFAVQPARAAPLPGPRPPRPLFRRWSKPVSGRSPSPAGWPSPQTWWSSTVIPSGWWSAWLCCSGWWGWRGARGPRGPGAGSCRTFQPACSDPAARQRGQEQG